MITASVPLFCTVPTTKFLDILISCDIHTLVRAPNRGGMLGVRSNHARTYNYKFYEDFPVEIVGRGVCIAFSK